MSIGEARAIIDRLRLEPHPEGGWYRETWRAAAKPGDRASATAILFLLEQGQKSHWHKVDAAELWFWHAGASLSLELAATDRGPVQAVRLGQNVLANETPQQLIEPDQWQAAVADRGWALVSCVVSPAFEFSGFTLMPAGWRPDDPT